MRNKKIHFNHEIVLYSFKNPFILKMFMQRTKNQEKKRWKGKKSVSKINLTHKQLHQIYIIIKMTSKVKTNILYIASDSSSDQQSQKKSPLAEKLQKINQKNGFALIGHHKLNNNLISKGYFVQNANQQDYEIQKVTQSKKISQTVGIRRKSQNKMNRLKTDLPNVIQIKTTLNQKENQQEKHFQSPIEEVPKKMSQKPIDKCQRSKTLMFQFDDKQDDEICNEQIQALKVQCQKIKEDTQQQQKKSTTPETPSIQQDEQSIPQSTKPISITPTNLQQKIDKKQFLLSSIPLGMILQCKIEKKNQIGNFLLSQYDMIFRNYCSTHVVSCKKFIANFRSNYRISADHNDFSYMYNKVLGKVRASPDHKDLYSIYSSGQNPQKTSDPSKVNVRQILCTVRIRSGKGPRQVQIYLLKNGISYFNLLGITLKKQLNLQSLYSIEQNREKIHYFRSRKPQWVSNRGQYFLNFGGRVNQASIRNFILEDPITKNQVMLFGKNQNNLYNIDVSYPLSPFIALGIAIPQLDRDD